MHSLLNIQNVKIYIKTSNIRSYMFQSARQLETRVAQYCTTYNDVFLLIVSKKSVTLARLSISSLKMVRADRNM